MTDTTSAPTAEQIAEAQDVMRRAAEAEQAKRAEAMKPIADITTSPAWAEVHEAIHGLSPEFLSDLQIGPHLMALRTGMNGFNTLAPMPATGASA